MENIDKLLAARLCLKTNLEKSKALTSAIDKTGPRLEEINQRLPIFDNLCAKKCTLVAVKEHIDRSVGPTVAVLKVFSAVRGLEKLLLLSNPTSDLLGYLSVVKRLDEALKFLSNNCVLAIDWLCDTIEFLDQNQVTDELYLSNLKQSMKILKQSHALDGGLLNAFDKLEHEFQRLLIDNSTPLQMAMVSSSHGEGHYSIASSPLPVSVIQNLQAIVDRLKSNENRLQNCMAIYIDVRGTNAMASLEALGLDYLKVEITEFDNLMSIEGHIDKWCIHLEFAITHIFDLEHRICNDVFENIGSDTKTGCFSNIVMRSRFHDFLEFGNNVTKSKKDPIKLLKLLEMFFVLNKLRSSFNVLFGGKTCVQIQTQTRNLIKMIVEESCSIFSQLAIQVESQRRMSPPSDGTIQKLVSFLTEYFEELLDERYSGNLTQVLTIHQNWQQKEYKENFLKNEILNIMNILDLNLEKWSKSYEDTILSYIFRINNHYHLYKNLINTTKLGELMGKSRVKLHEEYIEYYVSIYLRESWDKLRSLLNQEDTNMVSAGISTTRELIKKRLNTFNEAFDEMYKNHSSWIITDKGLREKICELVILTVVPAYRNYMKKYGILIENDANAARFVRHSEESLVKMLSYLFKGKLGKYGSTKNSYLVDKIKNVVTNQLRLTLSAA